MPVVEIDHNRLRELREAAGHTRRSLCDSTGVNPNTIYHIERHGWTTFQTLKRLCVGLGLQPQDLLLQSGHRRVTVWFLGSNTGQNQTQVERTDSLLDAIANHLVEFESIRVVMGKSAMLQEFAQRYARAMPPNRFVPCAVMLYGRLRVWPLERVFKEAIGVMPDIGFVIGGDASKGRVRAEYSAARQVGIPMIPIKSTGGAAAKLSISAKLEPTLSKAFRRRDNVDAGDLAIAVVATIRAYGGK